VNQMCKKEKVERTKAENATQAKLGISASELPTPAQQAKIVAASVPFYERVTEQMQELAPSEEADAIAPLIEEREKVAKIVRQGGPSQPALAAIYKANKSAVQYGFKECSI
ncbi:MAG TPA: hypothetical protein VLC07_03085, partial [Solirubrobacterales bacterium]|nr:hypothetical protein [Solirubrobacterales bacterium]